MHTKTSLFDPRYFRYTVKRIFPYATVLLIFLILISFLTYAFYPSVSNLGALVYVDTLYLGATSNIGMYIIPVVLCVGMFGFLHKKNATDFILGAPVRRLSIFITNLITALIIIALILLLNLLFVALMFSMNITQNGESLCIPVQAYIHSYFYNLAGYMLVYAASSLAAALTGTMLSQAVLTYVIVFLNTFIVCFLQFPFVIQSIGGVLTIDYTVQVTNLLLIPDIASAPVTMLFLLFAGEEYHKFHGYTSLFKTPSAVLFTLAVAAVYILIGICLFRRYKAESSGKPFVNKGINCFAYAGVFAPFMLIAFLALADYGYPDNMTNPLFYIFIVVMWIGFVIGTLILNKGFTGFGRQMRLFLVILISTFVVSTAMYFIGEKSVRMFSFADEDLKSISVYMKPVNVSMADEENIGKNYIKVRIDDPSTLYLLKKGSYGEKFFYEVTCSDGRKLTLYSYLPEAFIDKLYEHIDSNEDVKKSLIVFPDAGGIVGTVVNFKTDTSPYWTYSSEIKDKNEAKRIIAECEAKYTEIPVRELYNSLENADYDMYYGIPNKYSSEYLNYGVIADGSINMTISALRFEKGQYFASDYKIEYDSSFFSEYSTEFHERAEVFLTMIEKGYTDYSTALLGGFNIEEKQYLNLYETVQALPEVMPEEFLETVRRVVKDPIIPDNTVGILLSTEYGKTVVFMNVDRDIRPLLDNYLEKSISSIRKDESDLIIALGALFDGENSICTGFYDDKAFDVTANDIADLLSEHSREIADIITTKVSASEMKKEYFFVALRERQENYYNDYGAFNTTIPITSEILSEISKRFNYSETKSFNLSPDNIEYIEFEDEIEGSKKIEDRNDIEYLLLLLRFYYFRNASENMRSSCFNSFEEVNNYYYIYISEDKYYEMGSKYLKYHYTDGSTEFSEVPYTFRLAEILSK